jgi:hypothetical protein
MPRNYLMLKFAQNIQEDCAHHLEAIRTGTATNYPVCAETMLVCGCLRGRPGGLGVRSRPTARLSLSMNSWLPNGAPRRVASRMRSFQASSSKPHRNTSCQRSPLYRAHHSPQSSKPSMSSCRQWAAAVDHRYSSAAVPPHRIPLHIGQRVPGMLRLQRATAKVSLPEVSATSARQVGVARVIGVRPAEDLRQAELPLGNHHEMHVVGHQQ